MRTMFDEETIEQDEITRADGERRSTWARRCADGPRSGTPALTPCEARVIDELRHAGYELTGRKFTRQIEWAA